MPSAADISLTKQISEGGKLLSIDVLDHFIICKDEEYSFLEKGLI
jgi:DNA repair protein RadC